MRHLFVINPFAGKKKGSLDRVKGEITRFVSGLNDPYEVYITQKPMDACRKVAEEADLGDELYVYACGGDGTLNECVNGVAGRVNAAVTHYPCGTGNDFIRTFGEANVRKFSDFKLLCEGTVRAIDLIDCNGRYSVNICSVGIDARIGNDVHKYSGIPVIGGATGYVVSLIVNLIKGVKREFRISTPEESYSDEFTLVCACNGRYYGGGFNPVPEAMPDDGYIDFLIVKGVSRLKVIRIIMKYAKGRYNELQDTITHLRGNEIRVDSEREFVVNVDGESIYTDNLSMKLIPGALNFIFPAGMEYFNSGAEKTRG